MNLYKVQFESFLASRPYLVRFIVAKDAHAATSKYLEVIEHRSETSQIRTIFLCKRDEIIPTIEPIQEFL